MKKRLAFLFVLLVIALAACSSEQEQPKQDQPAAAEDAEKAPEQAAAGNPEKFEGEFIQEDANESETYMIATIEGDKITVSWYMNGGETVALYWAGTFEQPEGRAEYTFDSTNDTEQSQYALLASHDETKPMTVKDGKIGFDVTMMGVTTTVYLIPETTP